MTMTPSKHPCKQEFLETVLSAVSRDSTAHQQQSELNSHRGLRTFLGRLSMPRQDMGFCYPLSEVRPSTKLIKYIRPLHHHAHYDRVLACPA